MDVDCERPAADVVFEGDRDDPFGGHGDVVALGEGA